MNNEESVLTIKVFVDELDGDWNIQARGKEDKLVCSEGTMGYIYPQLTEEQVRLLAIYLVHKADEWLRGTRDNVE